MIPKARKPSSPAPDATVADLLRSVDELHGRLDTWGYQKVLTRGRGIALLFSGPPGTGKTAFAHAVAHRLDRPVLAIQTSRLLASTDPIEPVLREILRIAAATRAVVVMDDC